MRRSASGNSLELAHFTVKEFLTSSSDPLDKEYGVYHFGPKTDDAELAETCLTYLSFEDFGSGSRDSNKFSFKRWESFAFRQYAVRHWAEHARKNLTKPEVMSLTQQLLHPSKPLTFISWTQDLLWAFYDYKYVVADPKHKFSTTDIATASPLHFAAMLALPKSCEWLLQQGCDVDQSSAFGTPLACALVGVSALHTLKYIMWELMPSAELRVSLESTVKLIIDHGANVQKRFGDLSPMYVSLLRFDEISCVELLCGGATIDGQSNELLFRGGYDDLALGILESIQGEEIRPKDHATLLNASLSSKHLSTAGSLENLDYKWEDPMAAHTDYLSPFLTAAEYGQLSILQQLFHDHNISVNATGRQDQRSALHLAASNDHIEIVRYLQEYGADCTLPDSQGRTPLHASVEISGRYLCLQFLLGQNVDIGSIDKDGLTAWHLAASQGNIHALGILKDFAADEKLYPRLKANDGRTLVHYAAQSGSAETMTFFLNHSDEGAVHDRSLDGLTALHYAVNAILLNPPSSCEWDLGALEVLFTHGADPTSQDPTGSTVLTYLIKAWEEYNVEVGVDHYIDFISQLAIMISKILNSTKDEDFLTSVCTDPHLLCLAIISGREELAYEVLKYSPSVDATAHRISGVSSLQAACYYGCCSRQLLEELLRRSKADRGAAGVTSGLLLCACEGGDSNMSMKETVMALLDLGSNPNDRSVEGKTAMMLAAKVGHVAVVDLLIHHGADVSATDNNGWSVIHYACQSGSAELLLSLKRVTTDWNASITAKIHKDWSHNATALHLAASLNGYALEFLLNYDLISNVNSLTHYKETALWIAALFGRSRNVSLLIDKNADDKIGACGSEPPLHAAIRYGCMEVVMVFIDRGCNLLLQNGSGLTPELVARKYGHPDIANVLKEKTSAGGKNEPVLLDATLSSLTSTQ